MKIARGLSSNRFAIPFLPALHRDLLGLDMLAMPQNLIDQVAVLRFGIGSFTPF
jgi:hypothetical protein